MTDTQMILAGLGFWSVGAAISPQGDRANLSSAVGRIFLLAVGVAFFVPGMLRLWGIVH